MFNRKSRTIKRRNRTNRLMLVEGLEKRTVMTVDFGFTAVGSVLFFDINGDDQANSVVIGRDLSNNVVFEAATDFDGSGSFTLDEVEAGGTVSAGEIALARLATGTSSFGGFRVNGLAGNDVINGLGTGVAPRPLQYNLTATGGDGSDVLTGGQGADSLSGGAGNDTLNADRRDTFLSGGTGADTLNITSTSSAPVNFTVNNTDIETINGSALNDIVDNTNFADFSTANAAGIVTTNFAGNDGDDTLILSTNPNLVQNFNGGNGSDTISFQNFATDITFNLNNLPPGIISVENVTGGSGNDTLTGSGAANVINGGAGDDIINAGGGDDTVNAGAGDDQVNGGAGADVLNGDAGDDTIDGGAGADTINGGTGNDTLSGQNGNDTITGGDGADVVSGGNGADTIVIPWTDVTPVTITTPDDDSYNGDADSDVFQFAGVPVALTAIQFQNIVDDYLQIQGVYGLTDFGFPDSIARTA